MAQQPAATLPASTQRLRTIGVAIVFIVAFFLLDLGAREARKQLGDDVASKTGKDDFGDCLDLGFGSLVCAVKQGSKLYTNSIRANIIERSKQKAYHVALQSAISDGLVMSEAARKAQSTADLAAKTMSKQAKRISGPIFAAVWDALEVVYYGGSFVEVTMRATGTLGGTWAGGVVGESKLGRVGYLVGTQIGSWAGSKFALMCYDIGKAAQLISLEVQEFFTGTPEGETNKNTDDEVRRADYDGQELASENADEVMDNYEEETPGSDTVTSDSGGDWSWTSDEERAPNDEL